MASDKEIRDLIEAKDRALAQFADIMNWTYACDYMESQSESTWRWDGMDDSPVELARAALVLTVEEKGGAE